MVFSFELLVGCKVFSLGKVRANKPFGLLALWVVGLVLGRGFAGRLVLDGLGRLANLLDDGDEVFGLLDFASFDEGFVSLDKSGSVGLNLVGRAGLLSGGTLSQKLSIGVADFLGLAVGLHHFQILVVNLGVTLRAVNEVDSQIDLSGAFVNLHASDTSVHAVELAGEAHQLSVLVDDFLGDGGALFLGTGADALGCHFLADTQEL